MTHRVAAFGGSDDDRNTFYQFDSDRTTLRIIGASALDRDAVDGVGMVAVRPYEGSTYHTAYDHPEVAQADGYRDEGVFDHFYVLGGRYGDASYTDELDGVRQVADTALEQGRIAYRTRAMIDDAQVACTTTVQDEAMTTIDHVYRPDGTPQRIGVTAGDTVPGHGDDVLASLDGNVRHMRCDEPERQIADVLDGAAERFVIAALLPDDAAAAVSAALDGAGDAYER